MTDLYQPKPEHKFTFGLWTVGNVGRDPFGEPTRPPVSPVDLVRMLGEIGAYGVNFHDNDLVPIDATPAEQTHIVADFRRALDDNGLVVPMATTNLFTDPAFKDGAFTSNDPKVRAYALQKTMRAIDLGVGLGAWLYVFWGGREGTESDATKDPAEALKRFREALNFLCAYVIDQGYDLKFALEAKPNEPRSDIYLPTTGAMLAFIETLDDAGKLFHIDLNDQNYARYDQDLRFGSQNLKATFFLVKFLEEVGYDGPRHFDAHAYRTEDLAGVRDFAVGCMRTYLVLEEKARRFKDDAEIQALLAEINADDGSMAGFGGPYSRGKAAALKTHVFDRAALGRRGLGYERLDQLVIELLLGVR
jgi:xylose isomerase